MEIVYFAIFMLFVVSSFWLLVYKFPSLLCFSNSVDFIALFSRIKKKTSGKRLFSQTKLLSMIKHSAFKTEDDMEELKAAANFAD